MNREQKIKALVDNDYNALDRSDDDKSILAYHDIDFFNELVGYDQENIDEINDLEIGDRADFSYITGEHWVRRIA